MAIGNGLLSTLSPSTSTARWIGYQILLGAGRGAGMQMVRLISLYLHVSLTQSDTYNLQGMIAVQNALPPDQIPISLAFLIFIQNLGTSTFLVIATTIFTQTLVSDIKKYVPLVEPQRALESGGSAGAVRALVPPGSSELGSLLKAYSESVNNVFYLLVGTAIVGFFVCWGMGWKDLRRKKDEKKEAEQKKENVV